MKTGVFLLMIFFTLPALCFSQEKQNKYTFHSVNSVTMIGGSNDGSAGFQAVNGFQYKRWFAGIGTGLDYYLYRTIPVFADVRYEFGKKQNRFFVYADAGINVNWVQDYFYYTQFTSEATLGNDFKSGLYTDAGIGYKLAITKKGALVFTLGNSQKRLKEITSYADWRADGVLTSINHYHLNRIVLKIGWQF